MYQNSVVFTLVPFSTDIGKDVAIFFCKSELFIVLRFGKSHEMIINALNTIHLQDHFYRFVLTFCNINQACYLLLDNILWLNSIVVWDLLNYHQEFKDYWEIKITAENREEHFNLIVPKMDDRLDIIINTQNLGHFKSETVYSNLSCNTCLKYDKKGVVEHPALALPIISILDRVSFDLVLGFPENSKGYIGCLIVFQSLDLQKNGFRTVAKNQKSFKAYLILFEKIVLVNIIVAALINIVHCNF
ncbi:peroxisomal membrane 11B-like [Brachionus plicatilis]|uniref:Peroxisomal membrane 11B-like n=1 Tax=Brachionus plicatilis TaxID=10195 RepID=A0A3M7P4C9_BRAPC|nr:peroxisomal membrane 11B-like [Brachionus plicatilis]